MTDLSLDIQLDESKNVPAVIQCFRTLLLKCEESSIAKDAFREEGGLDLMVEYLSDVERPKIVKYASKLLALVIDGNTCNQSYLTRKEVVHAIKLIFEKLNFLPALKSTVVLISMMLFQNSAAQNLFFEEGLIEVLIQLYKKYLPVKNSENCYPDLNCAENHSDIWLCLNSALCSAVNIPLNENNQLLCSALFPVSIGIFAEFFNSEFIDSASSFLTVCIASNLPNQNAFADCNGPLILKRCLEKHFNALHLYENSCIYDVNKVTLENIKSIIRIICVSSLQHENNSKLFGKLGVVSLLMKIMSVDSLDVHLLDKTVLALSVIINAYSVNKMYLMQGENYQILLKKKSTVDDQQLQFALEFLIGNCLDNDKKILDDAIEKEVDESNSVKECPYLFAKNEKTIANPDPELGNNNRTFHFHENSKLDIKLLTNDLSNSGHENLDAPLLPNHEILKKCIIDLQNCKTKNVICHEIPELLYKGSCIDKKESESISKNKKNICLQHDKFESSTTQNTEKKIRQFFSNRDSPKEEIESFNNLLFSFKPIHSFCTETCNSKNEEYLKEIKTGKLRYYDGNCNIDLNDFMNFPSCENARKEVDEQASCSKPEISVTSESKEDNFIETFFTSTHKSFMEQREHLKDHRYLEAKSKGCLENVAENSRTKHHLTLSKVGKKTAKQLKCLKRNKGSCNNFVEVLCLGDATCSAHQLTTTSEMLQVFPTNLLL